MPHIIVEYSANIKKRPEAKTFLKKLHDALLATSDTYKIQDIKSRIVIHDNFLVADGVADQPFVHLQLAIMPREDQVKKVTSAKLLGVLKQTFAEIKNCSLSVEIRTLDKDCYNKATI